MNIDKPYADPFDGVDLATVDSDTLDAINTMREAAESAETDQFDPQIEAASGATIVQTGDIVFSKTTCKFLVASHRI